MTQSRSTWSSLGWQQPVRTVSHRKRLHQQKRLPKEGHICIKTNTKACLCLDDPYLYSIRACAVETAHYHSIPSCSQ